MTARSRVLRGVTFSPPPHQSNSPKYPSPTIETLDSDFIIIIAVLLCAVICALGLAVVARCAWFRRVADRGSAAPPPAKGLKKKVLKSLPKSTYGESTEQAAKLSDCAICLAEFAGGEEIRVLPQCGHGFHVVCIDTWLGCHSSCPSCRQVLQVARCQRCGGLPGNAGAPPAPRVNNFLP